MTIHRIVVGPLETNCYLVVCPEFCIIIDPGDEPEKILDVIHKHNLKPKAILLTHSHPDHTGGIKLLRSELDSLAIEF